MYQKTHKLKCSCLGLKDGAALSSTNFRITALFVLRLRIRKKMVILKLVHPLNLKKTYIHSFLKGTYENFIQSGYFELCLVVPYFFKKSNYSGKSFLIKRSL